MLCHCHVTLSEKKIILYGGLSNKLSLTQLSECYILSAKLHIAVANTIVTGDQWAAHHICVLISSSQNYPVVWVSEYACAMMNYFQLAEANEEQLG